MSNYGRLVKRLLFTSARSVHVLLTRLSRGHKQFMQTCFVSSGSRLFGPRSTCNCRLFVESATPTIIIVQSKKKKNAILRSRQLLTCIIISLCDTLDTEFKVPFRTCSSVSEEKVDMRTLTNLLVRRGCANIGRQPPVVVQHREMVIRTSKQRRKIRIVTTACVLFCLVGCILTRSFLICVASCWSSVNFFVYHLGGNTLN